jgi:hypothetical protein
MNKKTNQQKQREQYAKRRIVKDAQTGEVIGQNHPGYNVPMIRDFIEHLLLECRVQQWEDMQGLKLLGESAGPMSFAEQPVSDNLVEQLRPYIKKYVSALVPSHAFNGEGATPEEIRQCQIAFTKMNIQQRDEQIGHLEALEELFDEAFACAKVPFGISANGKPIQPLKEYSVREWVDRNKNE